MQDSSFSSVIGHRHITRLLDASLGHPAPAYLLYGPAHVGKRTVAELFMKALLGLVPEASLFSHPDFYALVPQEGKRMISVEQVREFREHAALRPVQAPRSVLFLPLADQLNEQGMNALLKIIEEPPAQAVFILLAEDISRIPKTIQSRSVALHFERVPVEDIQDALRIQSGDNNVSIVDALQFRGLPGKIFSQSTPEERSRQQEISALVEMLCAAVSLGKALEATERVSAWCDGQEDAGSAWREWCSSASRRMVEVLPTDPTRLPLAWGILEAMRLVGSPISPRMGLEAGLTHGESSPPVISHLSRPIGMVYFP